MGGRVGGWLGGWLGCWICLRIKLTSALVWVELRLSLAICERSQISGQWSIWYKNISKIIFFIIIITKTMRSDMLGVSGSLPLIITLYKVICKVTLIIGYIPAIWDVSVYYILQWHFIHFICLKKVLLPVNLLGSNKSMVWNMLKGLWEKTLGAWVWHFQLSF